MITAVSWARGSMLASSTSARIRQYRTDMNAVPRLAVPKIGQPSAAERSAYHAVETSIGVTMTNEDEMHLW